MEDKVFTIDIQEIKVAVDIVLLCNKDGQSYTLLIKRRYAPFENKWAFPGGFINDTEEFEDAARRELREETGIKDIKQLHQIGVFGKVDRDPRRRIISVAYVALVDKMPETESEDTEAVEKKWFTLNDIPAPLAFDHDEILKSALNEMEKGFN